MTSKNSRVKNPAVKFAVICIVVTITWTLIEHFLGYNTTNHEIGQFTRLLPAFVFYFFVIWSVWIRRTRQRNSLRFMQGFTTGVTVSLIYDVVATLWFALYGEVINKDYQSTLIEFERKKLETKGASAMEVADRLSQVQLSSGGSLRSYVLLFVFFAAAGCIIAALSAWAMRKKRA